MKYMQEFGYRVIPVNPFSAGEKVHGEIVVAKLNDIKIPVDIVDVFRPSEEAEEIANQTIKIGAQKMIRSERGSTSHSERFLKFNLSK